MEDGILVILVLYVDDLFLIGEVKLNTDARQRLDTEFDMKYLGMMHSVLRHGGVAECGWNLPWAREVCSGDSKEIQNVGLQGDSHTYGI